ncbi:acetyl-CoA synthetase [Polaromonas sp. OV174]|uniref:acyl-CoA synthetase n=1 Tax=Polaromonas sp. OV174 TaxID=1855300 RepID=UPI0008F0ABB4|nr:AMP-binding protein [Polaromonas sp. OV174]SFC78166.1 acetyl-CoA synthetase [Polaromonas sp. OV174]
MKRSQKRDSQRPAPSQPADAYAELHRGFRWQVDEYFNIAEVCCGRWARPQAGQRNAIKKIAICAHQTGAESTFYTYFELQQAADALSHVLAGLGVQRGDRVAIVMPQRFETAVAYMAVFQMGAVAMPLSMLFGPEALAYRLQDSEAVVAIGDESSMDSLKAIRSDCPALRTVLAAGQASGQGDLDYATAVAAQQRAFTAVKTRADEGAILIYTSGTTGPPKGALLAHRALIGNLPGFVCSQNWFGFDGQANAKSDAVFWSPADWAWTGGLMDALLPTLYFGRPIVAFNGRFSPELAFGLMQAQGVTHTFLFPTALKAMMKAYPQPRQHFKLQLQGIMSAGEAVGDAVFDYCREQLGVVVNEMFGQTEINYVVGNCSMNEAPGRPKQSSAPSGGSAAHAVASVGAMGWPARAGSMGKAYPGHQVAVIDDEGEECAVGVPGDVAVNRYDVHGDPDPIFFLGYWKNEAATRAKFSGDWCRTGDLARRDADGYLWYEGRADDVFKAAGYRIGPGEIENCLVKHPAVANAAVVPKPDKERGAVVKAYVVLAPDFIAARAQLTGDTGLFDLKMMAELQAHVKNLLAPYEYPKDIEFIEALPMTTTGKVQRRVLRLQEEARFKAATG